MSHYLDKNAVASFDYLLSQGLVTPAEMDIVTGIIGFSDKTMQKILYYKTRFYSFEEYEKEVNQ